MSLLVTCAGTQQPAIDLVSLPGLPQLSPTYAPRDESRWLKNVFSHQFPAARIVSFQYDFRKPKSRNADAGWGDLIDEAWALLYSLIDKRREPEQCDRSLVFLCHSFGGLILKQAILLAHERPEFSSIINNVAGVLFLGCIHDERDNSFEDCCFRCAIVEFNVLNVAKYDSLKSLKEPEELEKVKQVLLKFRDLEVTFPIRSFYENKETVYQIRKFRGDNSDLLCPEKLSRLRSPNEQLFPVPKDHLELTSFPSRTDPLLKQIIDVVRQLLHNIPKRQPDLSQKQADTENWVDTDLYTGFEQVMTPISDELPQGFEIIRQNTEVKLPCYELRPHQKNLNFVGRMDEKERIRKQLTPRAENEHVQRIYSLCGLGGVGKTQTALSYVFDHMANFQAILWAHADSRTKLLESFGGFAVKLGLVQDGQANPNECRDILKQWFETANVSWLLIFDNADGDSKDDIFQEFMPFGTNGSILITSRDRTLASMWDGDILDALERESAIELLLHLTRNTTRISSRSTNRESANWDTAAKIVERVGCIPIGITQAAQVINKEAWLLGDFLSAYSERELITSTREMKLVNKPGENYPHDLSTVWDMSYASLDKNQQKLLNIIAFLDPDRVQLDFLLEAAQKLSKEGNNSLDFIDTPLKFNRCKGAIVRSSLVSQNEDFRQLWMHRIVQQSCHLRMTPQERQKGFDIARALVMQMWPVPERTNRHRPDLWAKQQAYFPHVQVLAQFYDESQNEETPLKAGNDFAELLSGASFYSYERGVVEPVAPLLKVAQKYCTTHADCELLMVDIYWAKGSVETETNQFQACYDSFVTEYEWLQKSIQKGMVSLPDIRQVFACGGIGNGLQSLNKYAEAEQWYRKAFESWESVPGDRKIYTANMATCLWLQGKYEDAEKLILGVVTDWNDSSNFRTGHCLYTLGNVQISQQRLPQAYETHSQVLKLWKATLGDRHHKTGDIMHKLGWHLHQQRKYAQSILMLEQALSIYNNSVHYQNEIARTSNKLGCVLQDSGEIDEGRKMIEKAEKLYRKIFPERAAWTLDEEAFDKGVMFWSR